MNKVSNMGLVDFLLDYKQRFPDRFEFLRREAQTKMWLCRVRRKYPKLADRIDSFGLNSRLKHGSVQTLEYNDCPVCGKPMSDVLAKGCSTRCATLNPDVKAKSQATYYSRTGYRFGSSNPDVQAKRKANYKAKTGYDHWSGDPSIQAKKEQTNLSKLGVRFPTQDKEVMAKGLFNKFMTVRRKYGVDNVLQVPEVRAKIRKSHLDRRGVDHPMKDPVIREAKEATVRRLNKEDPGRRARILDKTERSNLVKWGYTHPMKNPEHFDSRMTKTKKWVSRTGKQYRVQGDEPVVFDFLESNGAKVTPGRKGLPAVTYKDSCGTLKTYYVDGQVTTPTGRKAVIEVKCIYTLGHWLENNLAKFSAARRVFRKLDMNFVLAVHLGDGCVTFIKNPTRTVVQELLDDYQQ